MNSRLVSLIRKEFIQLFRDKRMLAIILVIPLMQLFLLGYAATNEVRNIPMAVFDQSLSPESREFLELFQSTDYFKLSYSVNSDAEIRDLIEKSKVGVGLIIPPDYAAQLNQNQAQVAFIIDGTDPTMATTALSAAQLISQNFATELMVEKMNRRGLNMDLTLPVEIRTTVWYNPDMVSAYFMIPGVIGMILYTITAILTALLKS
jgi:ABC-2 type transport system permease protein